MTPQHQLKGDDCFRACVASVLGLDARGVPDWRHPDRDGWFAPARVFARCHGLDLFMVEWSGEVRHWLASFNGYSIVTGRTVRDTLHSVVYKGAQLAHDPAPEPAAFLHEPIDVILFVALDPEESRED